MSTNVGQQMYHHPFENATEYIYIQVLSMAAYGQDENGILEITSWRNEQTMRGDESNSGNGESTS